MIFILSEKNLVIEKKLDPISFDKLFHLLIDFSLQFIIIFEFVYSDKFFWLFFLLVFDNEFFFFSFLSIINFKFANSEDLELILEIGFSQ